MGTPYPDSGTRAHLAELLGLPFADDMQDWEFTVATPDTVVPAIGLYENCSTPQEKWSLMQLILSGLEEAAWEEEEATPEVWSQISDFLERDRAIHHLTVRYWACVGPENKHPPFAIAPKMRSIFDEISHDPPRRKIT